MDAKVKVTGDAAGPGDTIGEDEDEDPGPNVVGDGPDSEPGTDEDAPRSAPVVEP